MENNQNTFHMYLREISENVKQLGNSAMEINKYLQELKMQQDPKYPPLDQRRRWNKRQVMDLLNMSESTYKRNLKADLLIPMRLNGDDEYFEEDILRALEESRRRGRV
jgi:AraC-like DNA-binding protein